MPTSNAAAGPSTSYYTQIFCPVIKSYNKLTGQNLKTHCAASDLVNPAAVLKVFEDRVQDFDDRNVRNDDATLMEYLQITVDLLFTISTKLNLGENVDSEIVSVNAFLSYQILLEYLSQLSSPAKTICTAVIILLGVGLLQWLSSCLPVTRNISRPVMAINHTTLFLSSSNAFNIHFSVSEILRWLHTRPG